MTTPVFHCKRHGFHEGVDCPECEVYYLSKSPITLPKRSPRPEPQRPFVDPDAVENREWRGDRE